MKPIFLVEKPQNYLNKGLRKGDRRAQGLPQAGKPVPLVPGPRAQTSLIIILIVRIAAMSAALLLLAGFPGVTAAPEYSQQGNPFAQVTIRGVTIKAEVVQSPEKLYLGLSHRAGLPPGRGMLFLMADDEIQHFCMRDMHFAIDIIWISRGRVAGLHQNLSPADPGTFSSPVPVRQVLEVPAGFCAQHGIRVHDQVSISR